MAHDENLVGSFIQLLEIKRYSFKSIKTYTMILRGAILFQVTLRTSPKRGSKGACSKRKGKRAFVAKAQGEGEWCLLAGCKYKVAPSALVGLRKAENEAEAIGRRPKGGLRPEAGGVFLVLLRSRSGQLLRRSPAQERRGGGEGFANPA